MYVKIGTTKYTKVRNISFSPQIDITSDSVPVNELSLEIQTADDIKVGQYIELYDDLNQLWCKYWITYADIVDVQFVKVEAASALYLLDRYTLPAKIYSGDTLEDALDTVFFHIGTNTYTVGSGLRAASIKGYAPEQTARERLQWLCLVCNAYVQQAFTEILKILPLDESTTTAIPVNRTYWKPSITYEDYVTEIEITTYAYKKGTPAGDDEYVEVGDNTYIQTEGLFNLQNPNAPASATPNIVKVDGVYLINDDNVSAIASRLAMLYFARIEVDADVINNKEYEPAQKVNIQLDDERGAIGYIESTDFKFGVQAKSALKIVGSEVRTLSNLTIRYMYHSLNAAVKQYSFPVGYVYKIKTIFVDKASDTHRYIYRPLNEYAEGTISAGENVNTQQMELALHRDKANKLLHIYSVSDIEWDSEDKVVEIG